MGAVLVAGLASMQLACGGVSTRGQGPQRSRHTFAGFSVELPAGTLRESGANSYIAGAAQLDFPSQHIGISIGWNRSKMDKGFSVREVAAREGNGARVVDLAPPGLVGFTLETWLGGLSRYMSMIVCDRRMVFVNSTLVTRGGLAIHGSLIKSFRCEPIPGAMTGADPRFIVIETPPGWPIEVSPPGGVPTTVLGSVAEGASIMLETHPRLGADSGFDVLGHTKKQLKGASATDVVIETLQRIGGRGATGDIRFTAGMGGVPVVGYATAHHCETIQAFGFILVVCTDPRRADDLYALAQRAHCVPR